MLHYNNLESIKEQIERGEGASVRWADIKMPELIRLFHMFPAETEESEAVRSLICLRGGWINKQGELEFVPQMSDRRVLNLFKYVLKLAAFYGTERANAEIPPEPHPIVKQVKDLTLMDLMLRGEYARDSLDAMIYEVDEWGDPIHDSYIDEEYLRWEYQSQLKHNRRRKLANQYFYGFLRIHPSWKHLIERMDRVREIPSGDTIREESELIKGVIDLIQPLDLDRMFGSKSNLKNYLSEMKWLKHHLAEQEAKKREEAEREMRLQQIVGKDFTEGDGWYGGLPEHD